MAQTPDKATDAGVEEKFQPKNERDITFQEKERILKDYLLEVIGKKPNSLVMDGAGVGVKTPITRPKTFEEAGELAKEIFNN